MLYSVGMNNDSTLVPSDSLDSVTAQAPVSDDSVANLPSLPTAEQLGISVETGHVPALTQGDTFEFPVTVSWSVNGSALLVVPVNSATAKGITQLGVSQESARTVVNGQEKASITFTYKLVVNDTGALNIPALKFEIPTQLGSSIEMRSEAVAVQVNAPFNPVPVLVGALVGLCVVVAALWRMRRRKQASAKAAASAAFEESIRSKMVVLKQRTNAADSREWLLELESVCKEYAAAKFGMNAETVNLEELQKNGELEGWESLLEEFAHARYGGGKRDGYENRETWKGAMRLMGIQEEE